uniref:Enoyl-CoA hydratase n=1 Tax=Parastrongyloides trichosuri TaxID=131310 RepID=A0A0N4Z224_PARTI
MKTNFVRFILTRPKGLITTKKIGTKNNIALISLNSPRTLNSLGNELMFQFKNACKEAEKDSSINAIMISSSTNKAFSQGADIRELTNYTYEDIINLDFPKDWYFLSDIKKIKIALINGICFGGGLEIALMCDKRYASKNATFALPEIKLGIIPGCGGTQRLPRLIKKSAAMEMVLTGEKITADEGYSLGLLDGILNSNDLLSEAVMLIEHNELSSN